MISETARRLLEPAAWSEAPCAVPLSLQENHALFRVIPPDGKSLFTGYFEPVLKGSLQRGGPYQYPLYRPPPDLVSVANFEGSNQPGLKAWGRFENGRLVPHLARAAIENGALDNKNLTLLFVGDPLDLFFLQVQGSGKIILPDGSERRVRFAGKNGHPYTAIGGVLKREENLNPVTMRAIKTYLRAHPEKQDKVLHQNASYIFFEFLDGAGPVGSAGTVLQAQKSLAVDDTLWPMGLDVIAQTTHPLTPEEPLVLLMKTADSGSAIRGPARGDIFFGAGNEAGALAGAMNASGTLWIILPQI